MNTHSRCTDHAIVTDFGTIGVNSASIASVWFTVYGKVTSLKNRRRMWWDYRTKKPRIAKSADAEKYMTDFCLQVPKEYRNLRLGSKEQPLRAIITTWFPTWKSDLDFQIILDSLQLSEVISNDRWVREHHFWAEVDPKNPRCEILLEEI